ncbi:unnamed protein product [Candida verbasci]|uniref:Uncharacterized protein n=1 Tax=Candida verbasci TaxID=1227364 RepID=A0A9W4TZ89_9ASCO|nr:unnamed protein product [Candida verbasci]
MEIKVISNKPVQKTDIRERERTSDPTGFTTRLESRPGLNSGKISDFLSKQGKILKPFTITNKQDLQKKVFGTGQMLPSMTVEEYLDYELANGKMMKEEQPQAEKFSEDEDSDDELEKRRWDDWKDENPKGSGNMGANIG